MKTCVECGAEDLPDNAKFCPQCGVPQTRRCPSCGAEALPSARFCTDCGTRLDEAAEPPAAPPPPAMPAEPEPESAAAPSPEPGEHRQITAVFCDIVGYTTLSQSLDPEVIQEVIRRFRTLCAEAVARYDGIVSRYLGDGVLIYFGYPSAHEDDAERAVQTAIAIQRALAEARQSDGYPVHARIGIATGPVVVSDLEGGDSDPERTLVGNALNLAARVQDRAGTDGIAIAALTRRLVGELFELEDLGEQVLKGFGEPVGIFLVVGEGAGGGRFQAKRAAGGLGRFVGRGWEIDLLRGRWKLAQDGDGQVVLVSGEAGIGKSRLVDQLSLEVEQSGGDRVLLSCAPYHVNTAFQPVIAHLAKEAGIEADQPPDARLDLLRAYLGAEHGEDPTALTLCAKLLSIPTEGRLPPLGITPQQQRKRTQQILIERLAQRARTKPLLLLLEDAHWIDPSTNELVDYVVSGATSLPLLVVITARPEYRVAWADLPHVACLSLSRLEQRYSVQIAEHSAGGKQLPHALLAEIVKRTDGVPLFIEELTKHLVESGVLVEHEDRYELAGELPALSVPNTLRDSLTARLDRLGEAKSVAQAGSVIGRGFRHDLLALIADLPEEPLGGALERLIGAGLLMRRGDPPDTVYGFKHALVQDTAYRSMLRRRRQSLHGRIAALLEERFPVIREQEPEVLAHHWCEAGEVARALDYLESAGLRALERSNYVEGIASLRRALDLLSRQSESADRMERELRLQTALGGALIATRGFASEETGAAYQRAAKLCGKVGETPSLYPVRYGVFVYHLVRGELDQALVLAEELMRSASAQDDPAHHLAANRTLGSCLTFSGRWHEADVLLERALDLYDRSRHASLAVPYAQDPRIAALALKSWCQLQQGRFDDAVQTAEMAVSEARAFDHLHTLAYALGLAGVMFHQFCGDIQRTRAGVNALSELCGRQPVPLWSGLAECIDGWCVAVNGDVEAGIARMSKGYEDFVATGARLFLPYYNALIAEVHLAGGERRRALARLDAAQQLMSEHPEGWFAAELDRRHGDALREAGDIEAARRHYQRGLERARAQDGLLAELRLATGLATLMRDQGENAEARALLQPIYEGFSQGFDRPDLTRARRVLATLGWD